MIAMLIAFFVVFLSFNFFTISYELNGINRIVLSMPLSVFETAINMYDINEDDGPYFDKFYLEDNVSSYFDFHLARYVEEYSLYFYYYNPTDHSLDMDDEARAVEVTITTTLVLSTPYSKTMYYEIRSQ